MFEKATVFVLGAGASCHYGYPTGEELVAHVVRCTRMFREYCENRKTAAFNQNHFPRFMNPEGAEMNVHQAYRLWDEQIEQCDNLTARLEAVEPVVIDYFLGWNEPLADLGRIMIGGALLQCEAEGAGKAKPQRSDEAYTGKNNWIRFIVHQLLKDCRVSSDLHKSDIRFVTFNYDRSFESSLGRALGAVGFLKGEDIFKFLGSGRIIHMYGALRDGPPATTADYHALTSRFSHTGVDPMMNATRLLELWDGSTQDLRVIDPHTKHDSEAAGDAQKCLTRAERIYFLGYAFDPENNRRLGLKNLQSQSISKRYCVTNFRNSGTVNMHAGSILNFPDMQTRAGSYFVNGNQILQKSDRNCYEAIALDFGMLSE